LLTHTQWYCNPFTPSFVPWWRAVMVFLPLEWKWRIVPHKGGDLGLPGIHFSILNSTQSGESPCPSGAQQ